ncbi:MAG TPA: amidohydrolase family protein [Acidimicrobiales bacterium]|nr:amidohydrolase family protein [Acidimicrobiales bacterium]
MNGKIALEEHFAIPLYNMRPHFLNLEVWQNVERRLADFRELRLERMDATGIGRAIISLTSPGVQGQRDVKEAVNGARTANDVLAQEIAENPDRFAGFAAVPLQDVDQAVGELHRAVTELGFKGVLINSYTAMPDGNSAHLDEERFDPFWSALEELNVPLYLHPQILPADQRGAIAKWPEMAGPVWEFATETSVAALRLITSGLFDRHPKAQVLLGHLGESLPFNIWRTENRMRKAFDRVELNRSLTSYLTDNFYITTAGHFYTPSFLATVAVMGSDRVLYSVDYPFEEMEQGSEWFDNADIDESLRQKVGRDNAVRLFSL